MIILISSDDIKQLSFPDTEVTEFYLDREVNIFKLNCSDGYIERNDKGRSIEKVTFTINNFENLKIREYRWDEKSWENIEVYSNEYALKDVCEFVIDKEKTILRGFSLKRGHWTEFAFTGGNRETSYQSVAD